MKKQKRTADAEPSPDDGVLEAELGGALLDLLLQPGLWPHQVLDELGDPPDGWVAMQAVQARGQVLRDGQRQVGGPGVEAVHDGQLNHLDVLVVGLTWVDDTEREAGLEGLDELP